MLCWSGLLTTYSNMFSVVASEGTYNANSVHSLNTHILQDASLNYFLIYGDCLLRRYRVGEVVDSYISWVDVVIAFGDRFSHRTALHGVQHVLEPTGRSPRHGTPCTERDQHCRPSMRSMQTI